MESECCSTSVAEETARAKFHASLNVSDLARSVAFYRVLLGLAPAKERPDYAKFELDDPPLVLTLMPGRPSAGGILNHFGLRVTSAEDLVEIQRQLEVAGIRTKREEGVECCYARQTKFWVSDPDHALWEIYVVHEDLDERGDGQVPAAGQLDAAANEPPSPVRMVWQHHLGEPVPSRIPRDDHALHEVFLEGTANARLESATIAALFAETFRVLRPGGELCLHGLTGDTPLKEALPPLPGPAAAVERVPTHAEVVRLFLDAGFTNVRLEKLSSTAHFTVGGVPLREIIVIGYKPGHRTKVPTHSAIYLGPFAQVTDDFGNLFRCGEPTALNVHDWQVLSESTIAASFLFLSLPKNTTAPNS